VPDQPLSDDERRALGLASRPHAAFVSTDPEPERLHVARQLAKRLERRGLAKIIDGRLRITTAGQRALHAPLPPEPAVYLRRRYGLTTRLDQAVRDEPEVMAPPSEAWAEIAEARRVSIHADTDAMRLSGLTDPADRLRELLALAAERGGDVRSEVRLIERGIASLDRKLRANTGAAAA